MISIVFLRIKALIPYRPAIAVRVGLEQSRRPEGAVNFKMIDFSAGGLGF